MLRYLTAAVVAAAMAFAAALGVIRLWDAESAPPIVIEDPRPNATIVVGVEGAVATPGVYPLRGDARLKDALDAAGGATIDADLSQLNLAARLIDEQRLIVPTRSPAGAPAVTTGAGAPASATSDSPAPQATVNINTATAAELEDLPRIGPTLALRIVDYRAAHGPFRSVDELALVEGISLAMVDELRPFVTV